MSRLQYTPIQLFERTYGVEYTEYEWKRINDINIARTRRLSEVEGYVMWIKPYTFLLVPTLLCPNPYILCRAEGSISPPDRSLIHAKGKWIPRINRDGQPHYVFVTEHYDVLKPDFKQLKPEISYKDLKDIIFDAWQLDEPIKDLISYSIVSSPKALERSGGFSLSLYSDVGMKRASQMLVGHVKRFIPKEILAQRRYSLQIKEVNTTATVSPLSWLYKTYSADEELSNEAITFLQRKNLPADELTMSLYSKDMAPLSLKEPPVALSDAPILIKGGEKKRGLYDSSHDVMKFIINVHMISELIPSTVSIELREKGIEFLRQKLVQLAEDYPILKKHEGENSILSLSVHGKPLSLMHLALSDGRANVAQINLDTIEKVFEIFRQDMDNTISVWEEVFPEDKKYDFSDFSQEHRAIIRYIRSNGPSRYSDVLRDSNMSEAKFTVLWNELFNRGLIYEKEHGTFDIVPSYSG